MQIMGVFDLFALIMNKIHPFWPVVYLYNKWLVKIVQVNRGKGCGMG
jgi:hypothetical protein